MLRTAIVCAVLLSLICPSLAAPVPKDDREAEEKKLEALWLKLLDGDQLTMLRLARSKRMLEFLDRKLHPVQLTKDQAEKWLADLGSHDVKVWQPAYDNLFENDPRLVMKLDEFWGDLKPLARLRLVQILVQNHASQYGERLAGDDLTNEGYVDAVLLKTPGKWIYSGSWSVDLLPGPNRQAGQQLPPWGIEPLIETVRHAHWRRVEHAILMLEADGSKEAVAILRRLAGGHEKASPTIHAKRALEQLGDK